MRARSVVRVVLAACSLGACGGGVELAADPSTDGGGVDTDAGTTAAEASAGANVEPLDASSAPDGADASIAHECVVVSDAAPPNPPYLCAQAVYASCNYSVGTPDCGVCPGYPTSADSSRTRNFSGCGADGGDISCFYCQP